MKSDIFILKSDHVNATSNETCPSKFLMNEKYYLYLYFDKIIIKDILSKIDHLFLIVIFSNNILLLLLILV